MLLFIYLQPMQVECDDQEGSNQRVHQYTLSNGTVPHAFVPVHVQDQLFVSFHNAKNSQKCH